jgi:hypothetical protein
VLLLVSLLEMQGVKLLQMLLEMLLGMQGGPLRSLMSTCKTQMARTRMHRTQGLLLQQQQPQQQQRRRRQQHRRVMGH